MHMPVSRPAVTVLTAMSVDGIHLADHGLAHPDERARRERLRAQFDAVLMDESAITAWASSGTETALLLPESLRVQRRIEDRPDLPLYILAVSDATCLLTTLGIDRLRHGRIWVWTSTRTPAAAVDQLRQADCRVVMVEWGEVDLAHMLDELFQAGIRLLLVEGSPDLQAALYHQDLVDEIAVFVAPTVLGVQDGGGARETPRGRFARSLTLTVTEDMADDGIALYYTVTSANDEAPIAPSPTIRTFPTSPTSHTDG